MATNDEIRAQLAKFPWDLAALSTLISESTRLLKESDTLAAVIDELPNFKLNGSDPVSQVKGTLDDLGSTTQALRTANEKLKELAREFEGALEENSRLALQRDRAQKTHNCSSCGAKLEYKWNSGSPAFFVTESGSRTVDSTLQFSDHGPTVSSGDGGKTWYWADETWGWNGPCKTEAEAIAAQTRYIETEL